MRPTVAVSTSVQSVQRSASWKDLLMLAMAILVFRALITSIGFVSAATIDSSSNLGPFVYENGWAWLACDSEYYAHIIVNGYPSQGYERRLLAFFPGYPLVTQLLTPFMSVENAMRAVSLVSAVLGTLVLFSWAHRLVGRRIAWIAVALFSVSTGAVFLSAGLSDSLFFFATVVTLYCAGRRWFWLAALSCAATTAIRPNGLAVAAMLGAIVLLTPTYPTLTRRLVMASLFGLIGYSSALIYQGALWARHEDPKIYFKMQDTWKADYQRDHLDQRAIEMQEIRQQHSSQVDQLIARIKNRAFKPGAWNKAIAYGLVAITLAALAFPPAGMHRAWFVLPLIVWLLVQIPDGGMRMNSLHRYALAAPMLWVWVATTFDRPRWRWAMLIGATGSLSIQCAYAWLFTRGVWCG